MFRPNLILLEDIEDLRIRRPLRALSSANPATNPWELSDDHFRRLFRINKAMATELIESLRPFLPIARRASDTSVETRVLATLRFLAHGGYQLTVGQDFTVRLSQRAVSDCINTVVEAINSHLCPQWIKFPEQNHELEELQARFYEKYGIRGVIGAIDGTHVALVAPPQNHPIYPEHLYINRKLYHSVNVMLVADVDHRILAVNARFPGSSHDSFIWRNSNLHTRLNEWYDNGRRDFWLIGDSGYPLQP